jgi:hypothetical protein
MASAMPVDKRMEEKTKCFIVRGGSGVILMGVYQGGSCINSIRGACMN